tara:strand:- start:298 stop:522 length:225 start_codon:yes stop_codon:yes gene_type:complete
MISSELTLSIFLLISLPQMPVDLINIFDVFLPQLLLYPNPTDPLNGEAAAMMLQNEKKYKEKVAGTRMKKLGNK